MKQETKQRLKYYSKIGQYIVLTLCWLMALVGITAYSVYWLRQNANYEQEVTKKDIMPRYANNDNFPLLYYPKDLTTYQSADFNDNLPIYDGHGSHYNLTVWQDSVIEFNGDNSYYIVSIWIDYHAGDQLEGWRVEDISFYNGSWVTALKSEPYNDSYFKYTIYDNGNFSFRQYIDPTHNDYEYIITLFNYVFNYIDGSIDFTFTSDYNFATLTSEVVTSERLIIPFNNQYNGDPSDEFVEFYIKADFMSNNILYKGILLILNKPIYIYKDGLQQVNFRGSLSQLMVKQVYYMRSLPPHMPYENFPLEFNIQNDCDLVATKHIVRYETYNDGQTDRQVAVYDYRQYDWTNNAYRLCYFNSSSYNSTYYPVFYPTDNSMWSNRLYVGLTLYQVLNNGYYDYDYRTNTYSTGASNDLSQVFTLLSGAFGGLTSLMYIQVLPGISLGLLFFVPLIVTIIIVVLRLVKK